MTGVLMVLAACQTGPEEPPKPQADPAARKACLAKGGDYRQGGILQEWICFETNPDAGSRCDTSKDCRGFCMAGNRSCSTVTPMFGCHSIIEDDGEVVEICID
jgi:hypothetical protein